MNVRVWNVLLGALAEGAKQNDIVLDVKSAHVCKRGSISNGTGISAFIDGLKCSEAIRIILNTMSNSSKEIKAPFPNSQSYCITASALQYGSSGVAMALDLFRNSTHAGIPADGRFINAVFRCFGDDISAALESWKGEIRTACLEHESRTRRAPVSVHRSRNKNLIAAYNGLLHVCGRALRPDIAVRLAYAMNREGIEPDEVSLNSYSGGKRIRGEMQNDQASDDREIEGGIMWTTLLPKPNMVEQYESLLYVECTKYNPNSKLTSGDKLVRIIL
jgi:pentatricopeptide repeat protein